MTDIEGAWLAGLFEGEGWISFVGKNSVQMGIGMTDRDVIERVAKIVGFGAVRPRHVDVGRKQQWEWEIYHRDRCIEVLTRLLPWFGERRSTKAKEALIRLANCRSWTRTE